MYIKLFLYIIFSYVIHSIRRDHLKYVRCYFISLLVYYIKWSLYLTINPFCWILSCIKHIWALYTEYIYFCTLCKIKFFNNKLYQNPFPPRVTWISGLVKSFVHYFIIISYCLNANYWTYIAFPSFYMAVCFCSLVNIF